MGEPAPSLLFIFHTWRFSAHLIFQEDQQKEVSQILKHLFRFWSKQRRLNIWRRAHLQISLPYLGRAWENSPLYNYNLAGRGTSSGSRLPGVSLNSGHFQAAEPSRASVKHNSSRTHLRALLQGFNECTWNHGTELPIARAWELLAVTNIFS